MEPMLAQPTTARDHLPDLLGDGWALSQKMDGHRLLMVGDGAGTVSVFNRRGEPTVFPGAASAAVANLGIPVAFDGELMDGGEFVAFDMPTAGRFVTKTTELVGRHAAMLQLVEAMGSPFRVVPLATTVDDKRTLIARVEAQNAEGWVAKKLSSTYQPGKRSRDWRKIKRTKTVDCVVEWVGTSESTGKDNMGLGLYKPGEYLPTNVGECGRLTGDGPRVKPGDCVSVQVLYASDGDRLYQPTRPILRTGEKSPMECTWDQLAEIRTDKTLIESL